MPLVSSVPACAAAVCAALGAVLSQPAAAADATRPTTPIEHVVVIFQENVSFDHYFGTYPHAANLPGEPVFKARAGTPKVNGLTPKLLTHNPNAAQPFRLPPARAVTCDQDHDYTEEQRAMNGGKMDKFVETLGNGDTPAGAGIVCSKSDVMAYFDGNTVTALWNLAQSFAMSDRFFSTEFGPSTPGALNLVSGNTSGAIQIKTKEVVTDPLTQISTVIGDPQPAFDDCTQYESVGMSGRNIGDLLTARGVSWGFFQGGFRPTQAYDATVPGSKAICGAAHVGSNGLKKPDYLPHHQPFQYYASTANPHHLAPLSPQLIGHNADVANHQYDIEDFWVAVQAGNLPAVSFLKAPAYQDGHAGYSDPLAEQAYLVDTLNRLQRLPEWAHMAVIITYDDSDGWYDHVMPPIVSPSRSAADALDGPGLCGKRAPAAGAAQGRCGYGPRLPLLVVSPWAKVNDVDHHTLDQTSVLRFIEDNWRLGRIGGGSLDVVAGALDSLFDFKRPRAKPVFLDRQTGQVVKAPPAP